MRAVFSPLIYNAAFLSLEKIAPSLHSLPFSPSSCKALSALFYYYKIMASAGE